MSSIGIKNHILLTRSTKHVTTQYEVDSNIKQSSKRHMEAISELDREAKQAFEVYYDKFNRLRVTTTKNMLLTNEGKWLLK